MKKRKKKKIIFQKDLRNADMLIRSGWLICYWNKKQELFSLANLEDLRMSK